MTSDGAACCREILRGLHCRSIRLFHSNAKLTSPGDDRHNGLLRDIHMGADDIKAVVEARGKGTAEVDDEVVGTAAGSDVAEILSRMKMRATMLATAITS